MRGRFIQAIMAAAALVVAGVVQPANAQQGRNVYRWAVGWDDGIGVRYLVSPQWGFGLRFKPSVHDHSNDMFYAPGPDEPFEPGNSQEVENYSFDVSVMIFRQVDIGRGFGLGPYSQVGYFRSSGETDNNSGDLLRTIETTEDRFSFELGVRPTYSFSERFVLETRFGLGIETSDRESVEMRTTGPQSRIEHQQSDFFAFGKDLGPGAVVQFMVYF